MKKFFYTLVCAVALLVAGCATPGINNERSVIKHQLELNVTSNESVTMAETSKYNLPNSPYLHPSTLTALSHDGEAFIKIFAGLSVSDYTRLTNDFLYLEKETNIRDVHIIINSPGGDAFSGMALADTITKFQKKGFRITAHGSGIIASAAVVVFAACNTRLATPGTLFMVHEAALWKWPGRETSSDILAQNELMNELQKRYLQYLPKKVISEERWLELIKMTTWFNVDKAKEWDLVQRIE